MLPTPTKTNGSAESTHKKWWLELDFQGILKRIKWEVDTASPRSSLPFQKKTPPSLRHKKTPAPGDIPLLNVA